MCKGKQECMIDIHPELFRFHPGKCVTSPGNIFFAQYTCSLPEQHVCIYIYIYIKLYKLHYLDKKGIPLI